eukprot:m.247813 g.247813  ORF g.247813 m.247813 type:complete len:126 (-) comp16130_c0_seq16:847-1224(-)
MEKEIPPQLQELVKRAVRCFYEPLAWVAIDLLVIFKCLSKTDLLHLMALDNGSEQENEKSKRELDSHLRTMRKDKLIEEEIHRIPSTEPVVNGVKPKDKIVYAYYINYGYFVDILRFRLLKMEKK